MWSSSSMTSSSATCACARSTLALPRSATRCAMPTRLSVRSRVQLGLAPPARAIGGLADGTRFAIGLARRSHRSRTVAAHTPKIPLAPSRPNDRPTGGAALLCAETSLMSTRRQLHETQSSLSTAETAGLESKREVRATAAHACRVPSLANQDCHIRQRAPRWGGTSSQPWHPAAPSFVA